jgi:hypothetical protein
MTGSKRGLIGKVKSIEGNDVVVDVKGDAQMFRLSQVARVDDSLITGGGGGGGYGYGRR